MPTDLIASTNSLADPSNIGISDASISTKALSIPSPKKAAIKCSTVDTVMPFLFLILVHSIGSTTF